MDRLRPASLAALGMVLWRRFHPWQPVGGLALARILDSVTGSKRHTAKGTVLDFVLFALALIGLRLIIVWVVNNTKNSVLMAILVHASWNTFYAMCLGSGLSRASRARQLFEPHAGRIRPGTAAYRGNGRANWLRPSNTTAR